MMTNTTQQFSLQRRISGWLIHLFTASAAIAGLFTLYAIYENQFILAFWLMGLTVFIDSVDGSLARFVGVKTVVPKIDGALLDNIVDYLNYVITPAFFLMVSHLLPHDWKVIGASMVVLASAYQFSQADAKTEDHFFKGFPSYWNFVVFYLFLAEMPSWINLSIIILLAVLIFVPIKYVYLTRIDNVSRSKPIRIALMFATLCYAIATLMLLIEYPVKNPAYIFITWLFGILYLSVSLYRTFIPMK